MTHDTYRLLVAGASGETGTALLRYLEPTDYAVRAFTGDERAESSLLSAGADEVVVGDLHDESDAARAVANVDAVICAVEPNWHSLFWGRLDVGSGVRTLVDAAVRAGVSYIVLESIIGVDDSRPGMVLPLRLLYHRRLVARAQTEDHVRSSGLGYTIIRRGRADGGDATHDIVVAEGGDTVSGSVRRSDVAWLLVAALTTPEARNRTFEVVSPRCVTDGAQGVVEVDWRGPESGLVARRSDYTIPSSQE
ncbi:NAD(P)H-binding protein [Haloarchaeobius sp. TZWWS8]|uniref:NAD(P)H-binding protein n=1 Tax=Haloarchaeobius sp. TZWWS8 TaxID=3446121 RepID=UPI003EBE355F